MGTWAPAPGKFERPLKQFLFKAHASILENPHLSPILVFQGQLVSTTELATNKLIGLLLNVGSELKTFHLSVCTFIQKKEKTKS